MIFAAGPSTPLALPTRSVTLLDAWTDLFRATAHDGSANWWDSTLSAAAAAGATTLSVTSATNLTNGEVIVLGFDSTVGETRIASTVVGTTITLDAALTRAHPSGLPARQLWYNDAHPYNAFVGHYLANSVTKPHTSIVLLGDSWSAPAGDEVVAFTAHIAKKLPATSVNAISLSGNYLGQQLAQWSQVTAYKPTLVVHLSGFVNDISQGRSTAQVAADVATLWDNCKAIGASLLMLGVCPYRPKPSESAAMRTAVINAVAALT